MLSNFSVFYVGSKCTNGSTLSISKLFFNWQWETLLLSEVNVECTM